MVELDAFFYIAAYNTLKFCIQDRLYRLWLLYDESYDRHPPCSRFELVGHVCSMSLARLIFGYCRAIDSGLGSSVAIHVMDVWTVGLCITLALGMAGNQAPPPRRVQVTHRIWPDWDQGLHVQILWSVRQYPALLGTADLVPACPISGFTDDDFPVRSRIPFLPDSPIPFIQFLGVYHYKFLNCCPVSARYIFFSWSCTNHAARATSVIAKTVFM